MVYTGRLGNASSRLSKFKLGMGAAAVVGGTVATNTPTTLTLAESATTLQLAGPVTLTLAPRDTTFEVHH